MLLALREYLEWHSPIPRFLNTAVLRLGTIIPIVHYPTQKKYIFTICAMPRFQTYIYSRQTGIWSERRRWDFKTLLQNSFCSNVQKNCITLSRMGNVCPCVILKYTKIANFTMSFSLLYNISQPNFAILLNWRCSFKLWQRIFLILQFFKFLVISVMAWKLSIKFIKWLLGKLWFVMHDWYWTFCKALNTC
jgi:hypothetical protein